MNSTTFLSLSVSVCLAPAVGLREPQVLTRGCVLGTNTYQGQNNLYLCSPTQDVKTRENRFGEITKTDMETSATLVHPNM